MKLKAWAAHTAFRHSLTIKNNREVDWWRYKERSNVECFFQKIKQFRRVATRYEKLAVRFLGVVHLCCALIWLK